MRLNLTSIGSCPSSSLASALVPRWKSQPRGHFHSTGLIFQLLALVCMLGGAPAQADVDPYRLYLAQRGDIPWESLSAEEQQALKRYRGQWDDYSSDRQQRLRQGAQRYMELPPDKRQQVEQQRRQYEQLSPQERERLRKEYQRRHNN